MAKFRKKPVVIEAVQFVHGFYENAPREFREAVCRSCDPGLPHIHTLEDRAGTCHWITLNDWIIKGVKGEFYACKPDIFALTYEPVIGLEK